MTSHFVLISFAHGKLNHAQLYPIYEALYYIIDTYTTGLEMETYARAVLIAPEITEHYRNDAISTRMGSPSGTSSFLLVTIKATLEK